MLNPLGLVDTLGFRAHAVSLARSQTAPSFQNRAIVSDARSHIDASSLPHRAWYPRSVVGRADMKFRPCAVGQTNVRQ